MFYKEPLNNSKKNVLTRSVATSIILYAPTYHNAEDEDKRKLYGTKHAQRYVYNLKNDKLHP
jgi:hypothetical protein